MINVLIFTPCFLQEFYYINMVYDPSIFLYFLHIPDVSFATLPLYF